MRKQVIDLFGTALYVCATHGSRLSRTKLRGFGVNLRDFCTAAWHEYIDASLSRYYAKLLSRRQVNRRYRIAQLTLTTPLSEECDVSPNSSSAFANDILADRRRGAISIDYRYIIIGLNLHI